RSLHTVVLVSSCCRCSSKASSVCSVSSAWPAASSAVSATARGWPVPGSTSSSSSSTPTVRIVIAQACQPAAASTGSEERRRSGGNRLRQRLDLGQPDSHVGVEPARQLQRLDVVGRVDEHGRGPPL